MANQMCTKLSKQVMFGINVSFYSYLSLMCKTGGGGWVAGDNGMQKEFLKQAKPNEGCCFTRET